MEENKSLQKLLEDLHALKEKQVEIKAGIDRLEQTISEQRLDTENNK